MIKKGKYFVAPQNDGSNFKALFKKLTASGAGRPVGADGFPPGPWTPDLLASAISEIDGNKSGIELRTVQLWFQENDRGISAVNIRWLARVFGCDDPSATADWQVVLSAALSAQRRQKRMKPPSDERGEMMPEAESLPVPTPMPPPAPREGDQGRSRGRGKFLLARASEALFSRGSPLDLPASVFAGAVALGFLSFIIGAHNVSYDLGGIQKQVGYMWAPNWTVLFLVFLPLFMGFVVDTLLFWKREGRQIMIEHIGSTESVKPWMHHVEASSYTFWVVFLICSAFAGVIQWVGVRLGPLLSGDNDYAIDWGTVALLRPDKVSVPESIMFTALTYTYMSVCFYALFVGLILLYKIINDFVKLSSGMTALEREVSVSDGRSLPKVIIGGVFRCTILVILTATAMKMQDRYLASDAPSIFVWMMRDIHDVMNIQNHKGSYIDASFPNHFSSLVVMLAMCFVFVYGIFRFRLHSTDRVLVGKMAFVGSVLCATYFLLSSFVGWVLLLGIASIISVYALFDPELSFGRARGNNA